MSIAVTTPTGHIGSRVAHLLIQAGVKPVLLVRDPSKLHEQVRAHSDVKVANLDDAASVVAATRGVTSLFWLNAPDYGSEDPIAGYVNKGKSAVQAIEANKIPKVVFLSSVAAELRHGAGLIDGLGITEELLEGTDASLLHLRPGFFFTNFFMQLDLLKQGFFAFPMQGDAKMPFVDPRDIGEVAAVNLLSDWSGRRTLGVHGPEHLSLTEAAAALSAGVGKPIQFQEAPMEQFRAGLLGTGMPQAIADGMVEMYTLFRSGYRPAEPRSVATTTPTTLAAWAQETLRPALA